VAGRLARARIAVGNNTALGGGSVTLVGGGLSTNGSSAWTLGNELAISGSSSLGDSVNTGLLSLSGRVNLGGNDGINGIK